METVELIIECSMDDRHEETIKSLGVIKYSLPMINSYVIEIPKEKLKKLRGIPGINSVCDNCIIKAQIFETKKVVNAINLSNYRNIRYTGKGITLAILDTGIAPVDDLCYPKNRIIAFKDFVNGKNEPYDDNAHGTHVAGIAAGNGHCSDGKYSGIAPECNIVSIKILDNNGHGNASDVLAGLQWLMDNREKYNIRIANLSIGTIDAGSNDPLVRAVEYAWDKGIVMTIAAGNNGPDARTVTSPGISKKVITVGASDDHKSSTIWGASLVNFSGRGPTSECIVKPDVLAPGADIISCLSTSDGISEKRRAELKLVSEHYVRMSGTSMATPVLSGAIALLLEKYPHLKPDDVKYLLKKSAVSLNYPKNQQGWGLLNIQELLNQEGLHVRQ